MTALNSTEQVRDAQIKALMEILSTNKSKNSGFKAEIRAPESIPSNDSGAMTLALLPKHGEFEILIPLAMHEETVRAPAEIKAAHVSHENGAAVICVTEMGRARLVSDIGTLEATSSSKTFDTTCDTIQTYSRFSHQGTVETKPLSMGTFSSMVEDLQVSLERHRANFETIVDEAKIHGIGTPS